VFDIGDVLEVTPRTGWPEQWATRLHKTAAQLSRASGRFWGLSSSFGGDLRAPRVTNRLLSPAFCDDFRLAEVAQHLLTREHEAFHADCAGGIRAQRTPGKRLHRRGEARLIDPCKASPRQGPRTANKAYGRPTGESPHRSSGFQARHPCRSIPRPGTDHAALKPPRSPDSPPNDEESRSGSWFCPEVDP